ncbi:unnamed protein product [Microthlaspi erraticum]|uniref:Retrotransposon gag domain-containing protein n=1 Tax=Microthlaspi erraticum TaxID=1685480 RepID=A0A6D2HXZ0_9BRAS|nr:unnamed protein product [Microthlaspi erraticum]
MSLDSPATMAAETRAQTALKESILVEIETALGPQLEEMFNRTETLEIKMDKQNAKLDKDLADMFEAIRLLSNPHQPSSPNSTNNKTPQHLLPPTATHDTTRTRSSTSNNYSGMTHLAKLDFPRFNGDRIKEWLFKVEQFFTIDHIPEDMKVGIASIHFDGPAATWHQSVIQSAVGTSILHDWSSYKLLLHERFADLLDDPIAELKQLQETDDISEYHGRFELIRTRVTMTEEDLVSNYLAGLRTDTQMHIRMFQPITIRQCLLLGRLYEKAHTKKPYTPTLPQNRTSKGLLPFKKELDQKPSFTMPSDKPKTPLPFLTIAQMGQRRADGLCYYCDEKYTLEHFLKMHKRTQLYMLTTEDEGSDDEILDEQVTEEQTGVIAQISINAMAGITDYMTMRVRGHHGKRPLFCLIDSGSTHNFIDKKNG